MMAVKMMAVIMMDAMMRVAQMKCGADKVYVEWSDNRRPEFDVFFNKIGTRESAIMITVKMAVTPKEARIEDRGLMGCLETSLLVPV